MFNAIGSLLADEWNSDRELGNSIVLSLSVILVIYWLREFHVNHVVGCGTTHSFIHATAPYANICNPD